MQDEFARCRQSLSPSQSDRATGHALLPATRSGRSATSVSGRSASLAFKAVCRSGHVPQPRLRTLPPGLKAFPRELSLTVTPVISPNVLNSARFEFSSAHVLFPTHQHLLSLQSEDPSFVPDRSVISRGANLSLLILVSVNY